MILFAVLRYNTGWDYNSYIETISNPGEWENSEFSRYSWFWIQLFKFSYNIKFPHFAIAFTNFLTYCIIYFALKTLRLSKVRIAQSLIVYILWNSLYLSSFSVIRQSISVGLGLLMFAYIQKQSFIKSLLSFGLAVSLHPSAIILILLYPIYFFKKYLNVKIAIISCFIFVLSAISIFMLIAQIGFFSDYLIYFGWTNDFGGLMVYVDLLVLGYFIFVFSQKKIISSVERQCYFICIISFFGRCLFFYLGIPGAISRILEYFVIFMIIILLPSLQIFKPTKQIINIAIFTLSLYFIVYLEITAPGASLASSGFVPYKFIFVQ